MPVSSIYLAITLFIKSEFGDKKTALCGYVSGHKLNLAVYINRIFVTKLNVFNIGAATFV